MISLVGKREIYKSLVVLGSAHSGNVPETTKDVESNFHDFLRAHQPEVPRFDIMGTEIVNDVSMEDRLADLYRLDSYSNDRDQSSLIGESFQGSTRERQKYLLKEAMEKMEKEMPEVYSLFQLSIDALFLRNGERAGGGSTSGAIGIIWINSRNHWNVQDLVELLVHELAHHLLFIDELRYLHFRDYNLLLKKENFAQSAILHQKRPVDKVFHSIVVAVEVLETRKKHFPESRKGHVHPPSDRLLNQTFEALESLRSLSNYGSLLTDRGQLIMQECSHALVNMLENRMRQSA